MTHSHGPHMHSGSTPSMKKATFEIALKGKRQIAENTMEFVFEKPAGFTFKAGQHMRMTLLNPSETDSEGDKRFLTLASTPQDPQLVIAMRMRDTAFKRVLGRMNIGEKVRIEILLDVPHGAFALHDDPSVPAVFIVGGIGVVPAYSMIKDWAQRRLSHKITLFYANRKPEDAPYLKELQDLAKQNPSFKLIATITQPEKTSQKWHGETGIINESMLNKYVSDLQSPIYYIAGMPKMVDAMKVLVTGLGVSGNNIKAEEWSGFKMGEHDQHSSYRPWRQHILIVGIVVALLIIGVLHVTAATSIRSMISFQNPLFYILIALMLIIIPLKFKHLVRFIRSGKK